MFESVFCSFFCNVTIGFEQTVSRVMVVLILVVVVVVVVVVLVLVEFGYYLCGHLAVVYPAQTGKVGGLCAVEAVVEASVVAVGEGDHELPRLLSGLRRTRMRIKMRMKTMVVTNASETDVQKGESYGLRIG